MQLIATLQQPLAPWFAELSQDCIMNVLIHRGPMLFQDNWCNMDISDSAHHWTAEFLLFRAPGHRRENVPIVDAGWYTDT